MNAPNPLINAITSLSDGDVPEWVRQYRKSGREWLNNNGLPNLKHESWKYTSLRQLQDHTFDRCEYAGEVNEAILSSMLMSGAVSIVLIDGYLSPTYSNLSDLPDGVTVSTLHESWLSRRDQLIQMTMLDHPFAQLNQAMLGSGLVLHVESGIKVDKPVQILHWQSAANSSPHVSCPRVLVSVEANAQVSVLETYGGERGANLTAVACGYWVKENADLKVYRSQLEDGIAYHFSMVKAFLSKDAKCELFSIGKGARLARQDILVSIDGEGAEVTLDGVYLTRVSQHNDLHTEIHHHRPNGQSSQLYKGVLDDNSRAVFNGKVVVHKGAQQTKAYQLNKNLILSPNAEVDTKPELQIDADDVKCSHGATVGQLNEDELFYLQSRAIPATEAKTMLCRAYIGDVLLKIRDQRVGAWLVKQVDSYFERATHV